jgi:hypothetical protein
MLGDIIRCSPLFAIVVMKLASVRLAILVDEIERRNGRHITVLH